MEGVEDNMKGRCLGEELLESAGPKMRVVFHGIECLYCDFCKRREKWRI